MRALIDMVNAALARLGEPRISSFDDPRAAARAASDSWESVRDDVLSKAAWAAASATARLTQSLPAPPGAAAFAPPADMLAIRRIDGVPGWRLEGRAVIGPADAGAPTIHYVRRLPVEQFDAAMTAAFEAGLAARLCAALGGGAEAAARLTNEYAAQLAMAERIDRRAPQRRVIGYGAADVDQWGWDYQR